MPHPLKYVTVTIAAADTKSTAFDMFGYRIAGVIGGSATWTAADIAFEVDPDGGGTFIQVIGNNGALSKLTGVSTTVAEYLIPSEITDCISAEQGKIISINTGTEAAEAQASAQTIKVLLVPLSY